MKTQGGRVLVIARRNLTVKIRLGDRADSGGERPGAGRHSASLAAPTTAYTDSDNRLFGELTPRDQNRAATPPRNPRTAAPGSVRYTSQDLRNLQSLMPGEPLDEASLAAERDARRSGRDAHGGHIRIIDFDKQQTTDKEKMRRGSGDMIIRYFD